MLPHIKTNSLKLLAVRLDRSDLRMSAAELNILSTSSELEREGAKSWNGRRPSSCHPHLSGHVLTAPRQGSRP